MKPIANEIELEPFAETQLNDRLVLDLPMPVLNAVKVEVSVRVGSAQTSVGELLGMKQGAVLSLDRLVDEPIDVLVGGHVVARGTLVAVGEQFGVRITETATAGMASVPSAE